MTPTAETTSTVVLATKVYVEGDARERTLRSLRGLVADRLSNLDATVDVDLRADDFPVVRIDGDDATAASNLLAEEFGAITESLAPGETAVGTLESWDDDGFVLDAGLPVRIPADALELGPGSPAQVRERFGLVQHLPLQFVVAESTDAPADAADEPGDANDSTTGVVGTLAEAERDRLFDWQRGPGRVNVNSATRSEVRATLNRAGHARDVVTVERLGLLEHSVICTEGTDPPGLIASIGEYLPAELRAVL